jgi:hypothetical protein
LIARSSPREIASDSAMPISRTPTAGGADPTSCWSRFLTTAWFAVKSIWSIAGTVTRPTRSDGLRRDTKRSAAVVVWRARPVPIEPWSTTSMIRRPPADPAFVLCTRPATASLAPSIDAAT